MVFFFSARLFLKLVQRLNSSFFFSLPQISDIVVGQEDVSAKEALLRWAQKTTHRYPNVSVSDFTQSWRDGLAFCAVIHRNRPDLLEWRKVERMRVRERIDLAFHVMEREYGVTRLLDPEGKRGGERKVPNHQRWHAKMEAPSKYVHVAYVYLHVWRRFVCSVGACQQNFCVGDQEEVYQECVVGWVM